MQYKERKVYIQTDRLILRSWTEQDLIELRKMNKDAEVMEFFPNMLSDEETDSLYLRIEDEMRACGYGLYAAEIKETGEFIGFIGFHAATFEAEFTPCIEKAGD